jgi:hypothetical protein
MPREAEQGRFQEGLPGIGDGMRGVSMYVHDC